MGISVIVVWLLPCPTYFMLVPRQGKSVVLERSRDQIVKAISWLRAGRCPEQCMHGLLPEFGLTLPQYSDGTYFSHALVLPYQSGIYWL
jgi:hypothetical protein